MNRTVIALLVFCSTSVLADDGFYLNINSAFQHQTASELTGSVDSFWQTGVGLGYKEALSPAWNALYELGVATANPEYSDANDGQTHSIYTRVLFEYNELSEQVKPFAGVGLQKTYATTDHYIDVKKSVGFNFYPEQKDYSISLMVSHSD
ncbi:hypothetical protein WH43_09700 [Rheinheimera sp. KL1]|uniref:outer membrane beta-barrel protein n=1 Tax=Rheinheimera sp. KL1 TaxID=1635005 RepID=UPI0006A9ACFD|nr:outer membrane beta-barrel protein [Rheinheimera sp. KL1]KOO58078.1 hypothetical protein WH43_09700 [Rheinheimera sp. KL1]